MKITCNIIEDLLPLYVDDMVSEDSSQLVEEHLKECLGPARKMQEEMMRENCLSAGRKDGNSAQINKNRGRATKKKIRRRIRKKEYSLLFWQLLSWRQQEESDITGTMTRRIISPGMKQIYQSKTAKYILQSVRWEG